MRVTFIGTGAAGGVPLYGCSCEACLRAQRDPAFRRAPCSALIEAGDTRVLIDAGRMDLHERFAPGKLSAIVLTHYHVDHVQGLFHLRWGVGEQIPVFGPPDSEGCADLFKHPGMLAFQSVRKFEPFEIGALRFTPLQLIHSKPTLGYAIEGSGGVRFAYLTDTLDLPPRSSKFLRDWGCFDLALDCSFPPQPEPRGHNDWDAACSTATEVGARRTWLTHVGHALDAWHMAHSAAVPDGVALARDELVVDLAGTSE